MYAYALYLRGTPKEGLRVLRCLYAQSRRFAAGHILPGIPEYFDGRGKGMYPYLTGAASWLLLTVQTRMFGVRGIQGDLELDPRLTAAQFDDEDLAAIRCRFAGKVLTVQYHNPGCLEPEDARVGVVTVDGRPLPMISRGRIARAEILALPDGAVLTAELQPRTTH